jgi:hypothetical protein
VGEALQRKYCKVCCVNEIEGRAQEVLAALDASWPVGAGGMRVVLRHVAGILGKAARSDGTKARRNRLRKRL